MNDTKEFPKYQYSEFTSDKQGQFVFRADTWEELLTAIQKPGNVLAINRGQAPPVNLNTEPETYAVRPAEPPHPAAQPIDNGQGTQVKVCLVHNKPYEHKKSQYGEFWSHWLGKDANGKNQYCNLKE